MGVVVVAAHETWPVAEKEVEEQARRMVEVLDLEAETIATANMWSKEPDGRRGCR